MGDVEEFEDVVEAVVGDSHCVFGRGELRERGGWAKGGTGKGIGNRTQGTTREGGSQSVCDIF